MLGGDACIALANREMMQDGDACIALDEGALQPPIGDRTLAVMLSAAKHLYAYRARPFAEFTLSKANVLRVTLVGNVGRLSPVILSEAKNLSCDSLDPEVRIPGHFPQIAVGVLKIA